MKHALVFLLLAGLLIGTASATTLTIPAANGTYSDARLTASLGDATFPSYRVAAGSSFDATTANATWVGLCGAGTTNQYTCLARGIWSGNKSYPDGFTATAGTFWVYTGTGSTYELGNWNVAMTGATPTDPWLVRATDYNKTLDTPLSNYVNRTTWGSGGKWIGFVLNEAGISYVNSASGNISLAMKYESDITNNAALITWGYLKWDRTKTIDTSYTGTTYDPYLELSNTTGADTTPPLGVTGLTNSTPTCNAVTFSWTNPVSDYDHVMLWLNNTQLSNSTGTSYAATGIPLDTDITLSLKTSDVAGNVNETFQNITAHTLASCPSNFPNGKYFYYAYGDSVTQSSVYYLSQMRDLFNASASVSHNTDGSGQSSSWGLSDVNNVGHNNGTHVYVMFGINDQNNVNWGTAVGTNLDATCTALEANGSTCHILIHTLTNESHFGYGYALYENQRDNITKTQARLTALGRPYVTTWDAIDSIPCNGAMDEWNGTLMLDAAHPNTLGHEYIARYVWNKTDFCDAYFRSGVAPVAAFSASNTTMCAGNVTRFTDASTNTPTSWYWEFGDGNTSTTQNPLVQYDVIGLKTVNLKATNAYGFDWENKTGYINVTTCAAPTPTPTPTPTTATPTSTPTPTPSGACLFINTTGATIEGNYTNISVIAGSSSWGVTVYNKTEGNISWWQCGGSTVVTGGGGSSGGGEASGAVLGIVGGMIGAIIMSRRKT